MAGSRQRRQENDDSSPCHVHILAFHFQSLQPASSWASSSSSCKWVLQRKGANRAAMVVSRVEAMGVVVGVERKEKYLRFLLDDGTGACIPCILWLNLLSLMSRPPRSHPHTTISTQVRAELGFQEASKVVLGVLLRVQGRVSSFNQQIQVTVSSLQVESDPNAELLHLLDCMSLALHHYDLLPSHSSDRPSCH
eukprot:c43463_g1_i1 orf=104-685(+)